MQPKESQDFKGVKTQYGGKTGTTNDHTDGWFMGITPNLVVGTWVGGSDSGFDLDICQMVKDQEWQDHSFLLSFKS